MSIANESVPSYPSATSEIRRVLRQGTFNARDSGWYPLEGDGDSVLSPRTLFRSDALCNLTDDDVEEAREIGLGLVLDLRDPHERDNAPDVEIPGAVNHSVMLYEGTLSEFPVDDYPTLPQLYDYILTEHRHKLVEAVGLIAETLPKPVIVHCMAGKDRTGLVIAMVQDLVGVPHELIIEDYSASQNLLGQDFVKRVEDVYSRADIDPRKIGEPIATPAHVLDTALRGIREEYGSVENYLEKYGLQPEQVEKIRRSLTSKRTDVLSPES